MNVAVRCTNERLRTREYNRLHSYALFPRNIAQSEIRSFRAKNIIGSRLNYSIFTSRFFWWLVTKPTKDILVHGNIIFGYKKCTANNDTSNDQ
jgi:hypothetical protein